MSVSKMKDGKRWYVYLRYKDWTGKTIQHKKEGFAKKADAVAYERAFLDKQQGSTDMLVSSLYQVYMEDAAARLKPTTYANKQFLFERHVLPFLGSKQINKVTAADIRKWQNALLTIKQDNGSPYSQTYLKTVNNQVSAMFNFAVRFYGLPSNPARQAGSMGKKKADSMQFWTVEEFGRFIASMEGRPKSIFCFSLLFWTGMRSGEMLALTPDDFDFTANTITINKNFARHNGEDLIMEPKTPKSRRTILITQALADMAKEYISTMYKPDQDTRLFYHNTKSFLNHEMKYGCEASGVKKIRIHDLRHSHASLLIELGFSPILIAERLGHENIETTLETYSHLYPNKQAQLIEKLEEMQTQK